jgi:hypothetical protein
MYEFFSSRSLTTEAMLPLLPCTARHWFIYKILKNSVVRGLSRMEGSAVAVNDYLNFWCVPYFCFTRSPRWGTGYERNLKHTEQNKRTSIRTATKTNWTRLTKWTHRPYLCCWCSPFGFCNTVLRFDIPRAEAIQLSVPFGYCSYAR